MARVVPCVISGGKDPFDLLLTLNSRERTQITEEWGRKKEAERRKTMLERMKQEEAHGKARRNKEKVLDVA